MCAGHHAKLVLAGNLQRLDVGGGLGQSDRHAPSPLSDWVRLRIDPVLERHEPFGDRGDGGDDASNDAARESQMPISVTTKGTIVPSVSASLMAALREV